jgi:adenylate cyclase
MNAGEVRFGRFRLDIQAGKLLREDQPVHLAGRALDILCTLAAAGGEVVTKDDLMRRLWPGRAVGESNLYVHLSTLRKVLHQNGCDSHLVTVPSRGYRLVGLQRPPPRDAREHPVMALPDRPSIAVLPFQNISGDSDQEYLVDGITEDIITALAKWRWFFVIARNSSFTYKGRSVDVRQVGAELGVRYILEGSVRRTGDRVRVTAQLIEAASGNYVWAENFDSELAAVYALQDELTQKIAAAIEPAITNMETLRARYRRPDDLAAWDHYLRGLWCLNQQTAEDAKAALVHFEKARQLDGNLTEAYVGIARAYHTEYGYALAAGRSPSNIKAADAARTALAHDGSNCYAHYILSLIAAHDRELDAAVRAARRAIELNRNFALGYFALAVASLYRDGPDEALTAVDTALRLSPHDPQRFLWLTLRGSALYLQGRYSEAIAAAEESRNLRWFYRAPRVLAASYAQLGIIPQARAAVAELRARHPAERTIADVVGRFKRAVDRDRYAEGLRKAGFPET